MMKRLLLVCGLVAVACNQSTVTEPAIVDLVDSDQFADIFNSADSEAAQLILLLSPT